MHNPSQRVDRYLRLGHFNGATEELWPEIVEMMQSGKYDLSALVTHEFPVDQITEALKLASQPNLAQKVCISF